MNEIDIKVKKVTDAYKKFTDRMQRLKSKILNFKKARETAGTLEKINEVKNKIKGL